MKTTLRELLFLAAIVLTSWNTATAQTATRLVWDENSASVVNGYSVTVDGVRVDYQLTPVGANGLCGCSIPLPFSGGRHTVVVGAYNTFGETLSAPLIAGPSANAGGPYSGQAGTALAVNGSGSSDSTGTITTYDWNWGDRYEHSRIVISGVSHLCVGRHIHDHVDNHRQRRRHGVRDDDGHGFQRPADSAPVRAVESNSGFGLHRGQHVSHASHVDLVISGCDELHRQLWYLEPAAAGGDRHHDAVICAALAARLARATSGRSSRATRRGQRPGQSGRLQPQPARPRPVPAACGRSRPRQVRWGMTRPLSNSA